MFSKITGLQNAEFMRYGVMHRNTFINSPGLLNAHFQMIENANIYFAGQITGVEGYMESAASGIIAGLNMARKLNGLEQIKLPIDTMTGALSSYISDIYNENNFQPMGANMGILPELDVRIKDKKEKYAAYAQRAINSLKSELLRVGYENNC